MTGDQLLYLELEDVVRIHAHIFAVNDETARRRLRDPGALASALARPLHHAAYQGADIATQAATLAHGIAQSQSFIDGNKRTALIAMATFLGLNGWVLRATDDDLAAHVIAFAAGADPGDLAAAVRGSLTRLD